MLAKLGRIIIKIIDSALIAIFLLMVLMALLQVLFRFVLKISVPWTEELAKILYVYIVFIGAILVEHDDNQIKTTYFLDRFPHFLRRPTQILINVLSFIFVLFMGIGAVIMYEQAGTTNFGTMPMLTSSVLYIPMIIATPFILFFLVKRTIMGSEAPPSDEDLLREALMEGDEAK